MFLTVTIQTHNRAAVLAATLESLRDLRCPAQADYEIVVVNNNSTDATEEVIARYAAVLAPRLHGVFEARPGLSHARNRALHEARGDFVCFLDDDVKVDPGWLEAVAGAFAQYGAALVGGRSYLIFSGPRPRWLSERYEKLLSKLDYGNEPLVGTDKDLFGLNYSVRKDLALEVGGFDPQYGRVGRCLVSGEERDLQTRIQRAGGVVVYEPRAVVGHMVLPERLKPGWVLRRLFWDGVSAERDLLEQGVQRETLTHLARKTLSCFLSVVRSWLTLDFSSETFMEKSKNAVVQLGRLRERMRWRRNLRVARAVGAVRAEGEGQGPASA